MVKSNIGSEERKALQPLLVMSKLTTSMLFATKDTPKHVLKAGKEIVATNAPPEIKQILEPAADTIKIAAHVTKTSKNTIQTSYRLARLSSKGARTAVRATRAANAVFAAGKGVVIAVKLKKIAAFKALAIAKIAAQVAKVAVKIAVKIVVTLVKALASLVAIIVGAKVALVVALVVALTGLLLILISIFSTIPNLTDEQMSEYINLVRELDMQRQPPKTMFLCDFLKKHFQFMSHICRMLKELHF